MGTPLCIPYPRLRCSVWESCAEGEAVGERHLCRQDMGLCCISFLRPLDGNICLLTSTLTYNGSSPLGCTLRKWILSMRIRGFPEGEVQCKASKVLEEQECWCWELQTLPQVWARMVVHVRVLDCAKQSFAHADFPHVRTSLIAKSSCGSSPEACLRCNSLPHDFQPILMASSCFKPTLKARLEPQMIRVYFMCCWKKHYSAQIPVWVSPVCSGGRGCQMFCDKCDTFNFMGCLLCCVLLSSQSCSTWSLTKAIVLEEPKSPLLGSTWILALKSESWSTTHTSASLQSEYSLCVLIVSYYGLRIKLLF